MNFKNTYEELNFFNFMNEIVLKLTGLTCVWTNPTLWKLTYPLGIKPIGKIYNNSLETRRTP